MLQLAKCCLINFFFLARWMLQLAKGCYRRLDGYICILQLTGFFHYFICRRQTVRSSHFNRLDHEKRLREGTFTLVGTRTQNLQIRSLARYPLRHKSTLYRLVIKVKNMVICCIILLLQSYIYKIQLIRCHGSTGLSNFKFRAYAKKSPDARIIKKDARMRFFYFFIFYPIKR